jgi:predicted permease
MAVTVVLLVFAALLTRSLAAAQRADVGFKTDGLAIIGMDLENVGYSRERGQQFYRTALDRLRGLPGVIAVGAGSILPLGGLGALNDFAVQGAPPPPPDVNAEIAVASVTPDYFKAIGTPLQRGRVFTNLDHAKSPPVALLNEAAVRRWFPNEDPIGKTVLSGGPREVVGIVRDVLQRNPGQPAAPQMFLPYTQRTNRTVRFIIRAQGDPLALAPAVRDQIRTLDPNLPLADVVPLQEMVARSIARPRFYTSLLTLFAAVALALSATGIFGVMSYTVAQQSKEIGIRIALGANTTDVLRGVVGRALVLAAIGVGIGLVTALALGRVIRNQLFGVDVFDPVTMITVIAVLIGSAALASLLPARRAATIDPIAVFKQ